MIVILFVLLQLAVSTAFVPRLPPTRSFSDSWANYLAASNDHVATDVLKYSQLQSGFVVQLQLEQHKPLGCTVEESLVQDDEGAKHAFVTKVVPEGNAALAGIQVGDVIVQLTGIFGDLETVVGLGVDHVKERVAARPQDEPLEIGIVRGSDVQERHETALVELCSTAGADEKKLEECLLQFLKDGYDDDDDQDSQQDEPELDDDENADLYNLLWAHDMPAPIATQNDQESQQQQAPKVKPWSSRSSPSGTYVRDPTTGQMRNIDA